MTFVLSATDPGIANWIDTVSLAEGWMLVRWQGVPPGADPSRFIRDVRTVSLDALEGALPAGVPKLDLSERTAQIARRARLHAARTRSEARRVGKGWVSTCRSRGATDH